MFVSVWLSFWRMDVGGGVEVNWPSGRQEKNTGQGWDRVCAAQSIRHNSPWETSSLSGWRTLSYPMQQQVMNLGPARLHNTLFAVGRWGGNIHPHFNTLTQTPSKGPLWFARWRVGRSVGRLVDCCCHCCYLWFCTTYSGLEPLIRWTTTILLSDYYEITINCCRKAMIRYFQTFLLSILESWIWILTKKRF